jgi:rubredoxin
MSSPPTSENPEQSLASDSGPESAFPLPNTGSSTASTGVETEEPAAPDRHECRACGYIYEPDEGDRRAKIEPNTLFTDLPDNWRCPVCRTPKSQFINIGPKETASGFTENMGYGFGVNSMTQTQKRILIFGGLLIAFLFMMSFYAIK